MSTLKIDGTIQFPLASEATLSSRAFSAELVYTERNMDDIVLVGAQVDVSLMGMIADAKACYLEVLTGNGELKVNGGNPLPVDAAAGFWAWFNPSGGLTTLTVSTTANASFRVYMFS